MCGALQDLLALSAKHANQSLLEVYEQKKYAHKMCNVTIGAVHKFTLAHLTPATKGVDKVSRLHQHTVYRGGGGCPALIVKHAAINHSTRKVGTWNR